MARSIVGYTNDIYDDTFVPYHGVDTDTAETIVDNDPESTNYHGIGVNIKKDALGDSISEGDTSIKIEDITTSSDLTKKKSIKVRRSASIDNQLDLKLDGLYVKKFDDSELRSEINKKQNILYPGTGINIQNNIISSTVDISGFESIVNQRFDEVNRRLNNADEEINEVETRVDELVADDTRQWDAINTNSSRIGDLEHEIHRVESEIPSLEGYATEQWVEDKHYITEEAIEDKADISYVDDQVNNLNESISELNNKVDSKQDQLIAGANIKIENNIISADIDKVSEVFWADYNITPYADINNAYLEGKEILTIRDRRVYRLSQKLTGEQSPKPAYLFTCVTSQTVYELKIDEDNEWSLSAWTPLRKVEAADNTVTIIDKNPEENKVIVAGNYQAGENISIEGNIISAIGGSSGVIGRDFITNITVGHLASGTQIHTDDLIADLLYKILYKEVSNVILHYGVTNNIPESIEGLTELQVERTDLVGKIINMPAANNQYLVMACDKDIELTNWKTISPDWDIEFGQVENDNYNIYYINIPDPSIYDDGKITSDATEYKFIFREN